MHLKKNRYTGLEVTKTSLNISHVARQKERWQYISGQTVPLPEDTLRFSYKSQNIIAAEGFKTSIEAYIQSAGFKIDRVGLSLPNEIIKVLIQDYKEIPENEDEVAKMITFWTAKSVRLPQETLKISYQYIAHSRSQGHRFLVVIAIKEVVDQYLSILEQLDIKSNMVGPAAFNQFNFYCSQLPSEGSVGFLGIFDNYTTFMVFENDKLAYYQGIKAGLASLHIFFENFDRILQHYLRNNPDHLIEQLCIGSQVGLHRELAEVFGNLSDMDVEVLDEMQLIDSEMALNNIDTRKELAQFGSAIGAAQGSARSLD